MNWTFWDQECLFGNIEYVFQQALIPVGSLHNPILISLADAKQESVGADQEPVVVDGRAGIELASNSEIVGGQ